jgi:hypothetical protein
VSHQHKKNAKRMLVSFSFYSFFFFSDENVLAGKHKTTYMLDKLKSFVESLMMMYCCVERQIT